MWYPDEQLATAWRIAMPNEATPPSWPEFWKSVIAFDANTVPPPEQASLLNVCRSFRAAQRHRKDYLRDLLKECAGHDTLTLQIAVRDLRKHRLRHESGLKAIGNRVLPADFRSLIEDELDYYSDSILYIEDALSRRNDNAPGLKVQSITSKIQMQIELKKACEELKQRSPAAFHPDIDRAFRRAIDELQV